MVQRMKVPVNKTHKIGKTHVPAHVDIDLHNWLKKKFGKMLWIHNLDLFSNI